MESLIQQKCRVFLVVCLFALFCSLLHLIFPQFYSLLILTVAIDDLKTYKATIVFIKQLNTTTLPLYHSMSLGVNPSVFFEPPRLFFSVYIWSNFPFPSFLENTLLHRALCRVLMVSLIKEGHHIECFLLGINFIVSSIYQSKESTLIIHHIQERR